MNLYLFIPLLVVLQCVYWFIGRRSSSKVQGQRDYFLAGKSVRFFPLMMTFMATQIGGGLVLGAADAAFQYGWWVLLYPFGASLGLICLGLGLGRRLSGFPVSTIAQILEICYRSPFLKKIASVLSMISLFMVLVAQIIASHTFLITIGLSNPWLFALFWGIVILYTVGGGLRAVISTDIAQATVFSIVFCVSLGLLFYAGSIPAFSLSLSSFALSSSKVTGWFLMPLLYIVIGQDMGQRCFAGNSPGTVSKAAIWAGVCTMLICTVPILFGVLAKTAGLVIPLGASTLMTAIAFATNPWIAAGVGCAILAAIISTATSLINAISSNLSQDFEVFREKQNLRIARRVTLLISIGALFTAFYLNDIVGILIQSYELFISALFVPIFVALFKKRGNFLSALLSILIGMASFILFKIVPLPFPVEIASLLLSLLGYGCGEAVMHIQKQGEIKDAA